MTKRHDDRKAELLDRLAEQVRTRSAADEATDALAFLRQYYRGVAIADLLERDQDDLYGAMLAHLRFARQRRPGEASVRVYNPRIEQHGWQSTHTVVELVGDDMPFLVDSVTMELTRHGLMNHLIIHPVIAVRRAKSGRIEAVMPAGEAADGDGHQSFIPESFIHVEVDRQSDPAVLEGLERDLSRVLADVRAAVEDWPEMTARIEQALVELEPARRHVEAEDHEEVRAFLAWIADHHFTFLGYARYDLFENEDGDQLRRGPDDSLGILRRRGADEPLSRSFAELPREIRARARAPLPVLQITKANTRSTVHRPTYLDYVGIKRYDAEGGVIGEHRFLGLLTSAAYNRSAREIPLLRHKVARTLTRSGLSPASHDGKALVNILETYPRDELFQTDDEELFRTAEQILQLQERQRLRLFTRADPFARFVACLVYVPRERYNTSLRQKMQAILQEALGGTEVEFRAHISESVLARVFFIVRTPHGRIAEVDVAALEARLVEAARSWGDVLREALIEAQGEAEGNRLWTVYGNAFPVAYQDEIAAKLAVEDAVRMDRLARGLTDLAMSLYQRLEDDDRLLRFKLVRMDAPVHLSAALPVLENMGLRVLDERPYRLEGADGHVFHVHDFGMEPAPEAALDPKHVRAEFQESFDRVWHDQAENDGFNRLVLHAGMTWREVVILRAYCKYMLQIGIPFSQAYVEQTLGANARVARLLAEFFAARFDPDAEDGRDERVAGIEKTIREGLEQVAVIDEDRILRRFLQLMRATLRTNAFQTENGLPKSYLALKFDPARIPDMPLPRPAFEIFVYALRVEGVHLRGGKVARGGLRWSDRREDFRTEVLGLMKAQMVKNAVIVPVGAKGGFVVKRPPKNADRQALQEEGIACYETFLRGLLDVTDNRVGGEIVPPERVVRYDEDDPYLVVAADKGTATFSDIANRISADYDFWLGDAFASGGSAGYDHKGMGITAKGAWESVKHHFRAMDRDCQSEPFTCVGIGDMAGDVFGNGMLLSRQTRLIAAFNHMHIFLDPDPDPEVSFAERERLFALPRSSWADYDSAKIGEGGGVFPRTQKSIPLTPEVRRALDLDGEAEALSPQELIRAILKAPVDLLWNGGIGTYVKAKAETHAAAFDRSNDALRVDGEDLRCKIVGEGGNLGFTQKGRIAFALAGGRINTDFIDNSAGVDTSDHEVNIKILLGQVVDAGEMTLKQRDRLLAEMTDEVALLVLRDNILQNAAISLSAHMGEDLFDTQASFMRRLESQGRLSREIEELPNDDLLAERRSAGKGLTRPELAVLLSYSKLTLYADLLASDLPDDPYFTGDLVKYFPRGLRKRFADEIARHRLRRELVATSVANSLINRGLEVFAHELQDQTGAGADEIARVYVVARDAFGLIPIWGAIESLPPEVSGARQMAMLAEVRRLLLRGSGWFLRNLARPIAIEDAVARFRPGIDTLMDDLEVTLPPAAQAGFRATLDGHREAGVGEELASGMAALPYLLPACEVVTVAETVGIEIHRAARVFFAIDAALSLDELRRSFTRAKLSSRWDRLALAALQDDLLREQRELAVQALQSGLLERAQGNGGEDALVAWLERELTGIERVRRVLGEIEAVASPEVAMLAVGVRALGQLTPAG